MTDKSGMKLCVIGLGSMGLGIAGSLLRGGFDVTGCDAFPAAVDRFAALGGKVAATPALAAQGADAVITVVVNAAQTDTVLFGADGAAGVMAAGLVGFCVGSTATAVAAMDAITRRRGPAPRATALVPPTGGFLIDLTNAPVIGAFINLLR